jgi:hypothetical protein
MSGILLAISLGPILILQLPANLTTAEDERQERLQYMKEKAAKFTLAREASPEDLLTLQGVPILRFSNPERDSGTWDGATFLWLDGTRPIAAICFGIRRPNNAVFREHTSFSRTPLICIKSNSVSWAPQSGGLLNRELSKAPSPAEGAQVRLNQMRMLARRFSGTCYYKESATELRLMPQPLYRFADEKQGILDGALFALVVSNDAEMFLLLEAQGDPTRQLSKWHFSLARMSSLKQTIRLDDQEIWTVPAYYATPAAERKTSPYIEAFDGNFESPADSSHPK